MAAVSNTSIYTDTSFHIDNIAISNWLQWWTHKKAGVKLQRGEPLGEATAPDGKRANITRINIHVIRNSNSVELISKAKLCTHSKCTFPAWQFRGAVADLSVT